MSEPTENTKRVLQAVLEATSSSSLEWERMVVDPGVAMLELTYRLGQVANGVVDREVDSMRQELIALAATCVLWVRGLDSDESVVEDGLEDLVFGSQPDTYFEDVI
jgi:hypothetical protein